MLGFDDILRRRGRAEQSWRLLRMCMCVPQNRSFQLYSRARSENMKCKVSRDAYSCMFGFLPRPRFTSAIFARRYRMSSTP